MATINLPSPQQVYQAIGEPPGAFYGLTEAGDVYALINRLELVESAAASAELAADKAASPYDFPLPREVIAERNTNLDAGQVEERFVRQEKPFIKYILDKATSDLCRSLRPKSENMAGDPNETKRRSFKEGAEDALRTGLEYVAALKAGDVATAGAVPGSPTTAAFLTIDLD